MLKINLGICQSGTTDFDKYIENKTLYVYQTIPGRVSALKYLYQAGVSNNDAFKLSAKQIDIAFSRLSFGDCKVIYN